MDAFYRCGATATGQREAEDRAKRWNELYSNRASSANTQNVAKSGVIAQALGPLCNQLVFVGGLRGGSVAHRPRRCAPRVSYDGRFVGRGAPCPAITQWRRSCLDWASSAMWRRMRQSAAVVSRLAGGFEQPMCGSWIRESLYHWSRQRRKSQASKSGRAFTH